MPLLRGLAVTACLTAAVLCAPAGHPLTTPGAKTPATRRAVPGTLDVLYAAPGNADYAYGPTFQQRYALSANVAPSATMNVTYTGFGAFPAAQAAFQAAVDIWSHTIVSPVPDSNQRNLLAAGVEHTRPGGSHCRLHIERRRREHCIPGCPGGRPGRDGLLRRSWLADDRDHRHLQQQLSKLGVRHVRGRRYQPYSFMTVVLHELGHGLGLLGSTRASGGVGTYSSTPYIYDRFAATGAGVALLSFANASVALGAQLVSNDTYFKGAHAIATNGTAPKLETHDFTTAFGMTSDGGFVQGSSYSHIDEVLYSSTPNGLMTYALAGKRSIPTPARSSEAFSRTRGGRSPQPAAPTA